METILPLSDTIFKTLMLGMSYTNKQTRLIAFPADSFIGMNHAICSD